MALSRVPIDVKIHTKTHVLHEIEPGIKTHSFLFYILTVNKKFYTSKCFGLDSGFSLQKRRSCYVLLESAVCAPCHDINSSFVHDDSTL